MPGAADARLVAAISTFVPDGFQNVEGNTNWPYPWNYTNTTGGMRQMLVYDSGNFTGQGIAGPIQITNLRWRADGGATCTGRSYGSVNIQMSSCPSDYTAVSNTFAQNHGPDLATVFTGSVTINPPTPVNLPLQAPFHLPSGSYGVAVYISGVPTNSLAYSQNPIGPFANGDLSIHPNPGSAPGIAKAGLFTTSVYSGKWNGAFHYTRNGISGEAGYGFFGEGCPGSNGGTSGNTAVGQPRLGTTLTLGFDNLAQNAALLLIGFSNSSSPFGTLPLDLAPFGAPGCFGRVRPDFSMLLLGAAGTANVNLPIPTLAPLLGMVFYDQALVLDPAANAAGLVTSDAAGAVIGS